MPTFRPSSLYCSMPSLNESMVLAFGDELEKTAINWGGLASGARQAGGYLARQGTTVGAGTALGAAGGGLLGAGIGGVKGYRQAKEQGATTGQALLHGALGGGKGALLGGAAGGAVGGLAGLAGGGQARELAGKLRGRKGMLGGLARAGEREAHGLTGALPQVDAAGKAFGSKTEALRAMNLGAAPALKREAEAAKALTGSWKGVDPKVIAKRHKELTSARAHVAASKQMEELGATNVPGYLKALATRPLDTLSAGARQQWHGAGTGLGGTASRALTWGFPAAGAISAMRGPEEDAQGRGRGERVGRALGGATYGLMGMPLMGLSAMTGLATRAGGVLGRGVAPGQEKVGAAYPFKKKLLLGLVPPPGPEPEEADVYSPAVEHEQSDSAAGRSPAEGAFG